MLLTITIAVRENCNRCSGQASLVSCVRLLPKKQEGNLYNITRWNCPRKRLARHGWSDAKLLVELALSSCSYTVHGVAAVETERARARGRRRGRRWTPAASPKSHRPGNRERRVSERLSQLPLVIGVCQVALPRGPRPCRLA